MADAPNPAPDPGMVDPRTSHPGPEEVLFEPDVPLAGPEQPDPDANSPHDEDPRPADEAAGLVDPRAEIPGPGGP